MNARLLRCALASVTLVLSAGTVVSGCLTRPVVPGEPTTKTNFTTTVSQQAVDKIDLLFTIDNSASMGDKQAYLEQAIPNLVNRLVTPNCIGSDGVTVTGQSDTNGNCASGTVEFPPVHDMHIGIVSTSLGPRLGDTYNGGSGTVCPDDQQTMIGTASYQSHTDDHAYLLNRSNTPGSTNLNTTPLADAPSGFLAWFPPVSSNSSHTPPPSPTPAVTTATQLNTDFTDLVAGVQQFGCGIESQLESWYRFLIQPDPYSTLGTYVSTSNATMGQKLAQWVGVDSTILQERKDFLRPDSLVAIIVLTDENDSEIDVRSLGGQGYLWMSQTFPPPRGTSVCATNPADPNCQTCDGYKGSDPNCMMPPYMDPEDWGYDENLRHVHMKAKYGLDPQFPLTRYVNGLTSPTVPDRQGEYPTDSSGNVATSYVGQNDCINPLFAATLADPTKLSSTAATAAPLSAADQQVLCKLTPGSRPANLIFYAIIGGVPNQLLHFDPTSAANSTLTDADWVKILGQDPDNYNYTGIDPHMIESQTPRNMGQSGAPTYPTAAPITGETALADPSAANNADPWNGREWITNQGAHVDLHVDREYACIFPLTGMPRDCSAMSPENHLACDCSTLPGVLTHEETSPLCDPNIVTNQLYAKAYPTIRELNLAHKMGTQGIASSICPIDVTPSTGNIATDPLYGYNPAVATIVNRLKNALTNQCLPEKLSVDPAAHTVPCLILVTLPVGSNSCNQAGLQDPDPSILSTFQAQQKANFLANGGADAGLTDPSTLTTCAATEIPEPAGGSCKTSTSPGWCYVTGSAAGTCEQAILFTNQFPPNGSQISLQCIETSSALSDGG